MRRASDGARRTASGGFGIAELGGHGARPVERAAVGEQPRQGEPAQRAGHTEPDVGRRFLQGCAIAAEGAVPGLTAVFDGAALLGVADVADGFAHPRRVVPAAPISAVQAA